MAPEFSATLFLPDENATTELGKELAAALLPGDVILLKGAVGAGKSHLSRATIQARLGVCEDVPSPTYTLIQTYTDGEVEIVHADLYRLGDTSELVELGLDEAFQSAICLVEWPERLGEEDVPAGALTLTLETANEGRMATLTATDGRWEKLARPLKRSEFVIDAGWSASERTCVAGDLSSRTYQRLSRDGRKAILMDAGADAESTRKFLHMTDWLSSGGYSVPDVFAHNWEDGLIFLEDFGEEQLSARPDSIKEMGLCLALLADIRKKSAPDLPCPTVSELVEMTTLSELYPGSNRNSLRAFRKVLSACLKKAFDGVEPTVSLRDFHADNIMWLDGRQGIKQLGLLDYQDAFLTHPVYDLVSLLTDARRDIPKEVRQNLITEYASITGDNLDDLTAAFSAFSAQRNLRILGIFSRAATVFGKTHHVANLPRVYGYLVEALEHPVFQGAGKALLDGLPEPDKTVLDRLVA